MRIRKSGYIKSNETHCYTEKFNVALSLYRVLEVALYISKGFLEAAVRVLAVVEAPWVLEVTVVCFLEERSNCRELDCFLEAGDEDSLDRDNLVDKATRDGFALF